MCPRCAVGRKNKTAGNVRFACLATGRLSVNETCLRQSGAPLLRSGRTGATKTVALTTRPRLASEIGANRRLSNQGKRSRSMGWASETMTEASQRAIQRVTAMEERQDWTAANTEAFESAANAEVASGGDEPLL